MYLMCVYVYSIFILNYEVNMNLIYIRYVLKITVSCPFNRTAIFIPIFSLIVRYPIKIRSYSFQPSFEVRVHFCPFQIRFIFVPSFARGGLLFL